MSLWPIRTKDVITGRDNQSHDQEERSHDQITWSAHTPVMANVAEVSGFHGNQSCLLATQKKCLQFTGWQRLPLVSWTGQGNWSCLESCKDPSDHNQISQKSKEVRTKRGTDDLAQKSVTMFPFFNFIKVPPKPWKQNSMTFPWLSMTKSAIFHDPFHGQDSRNFS